MKRWCSAVPVLNLLMFVLQANIWLGTLLLERSDDIYRMKGLLSVEGMDERFVFQVCFVDYIIWHFVSFHTPLVLAFTSPTS